MFRVCVFILLISAFAGLGTFLPAARAVKPLGGDAENAAAEAGSTPVRVAAAPLKHVVRLHPQLFSGDRPNDLPAFRALAKMGVRTIISVDGATPNVEAARRCDLRYVHLPVGYDGIPVKRAAELAKAITSCDGPIYVHCHHGKHRAPAAAAVAGIAAGWITNKDGRAILDLAGTGQSYKGLHRSVSDVRRISTKALSQVSGAFPEVESVPPLVESMVPLESTFESLKQLMADNVESASATHQALLLKEHFAELRRLPEAKQYGDDFMQLLKSSESASNEIYQTLNSADRKNGTQSDRLLAEIKANCRSCHQRFRNGSAK